MAKRPKPRVRVRILLFEDAAIGLALVMRDLLRRADALAGGGRIDVRFCGRPGLDTVAAGDVSVRLGRADGRPDHLVVPPLVPGADPLCARPAEERLVARRHAAGATVHTACLGALVVARAGLLAGRPATTHWAWIDRAARAFPDVAWDGARMLLDDGDVVTAGGYLAAVDLALALVERIASPAVSREVGRLLLADSVRQRQSIYATRLVPSGDGGPRLRRLERWLDEHLDGPVDTAAMAAACGLGTRTFHRELVRACGVTPRKYLQLRRIERVRELLRDERTSVEAALARVGVSDLPSFREVFRRELGLTPAEYRRRLRGEPA